MKLLLIGFSKQNADVLQMLIERLYPDCELGVVERYFGGSLRLQLPKLQPLTAETMLIINLDGVGMVNFTAAHIIEIREFIQGRATMLVARHNLDKWRSTLPEEVGVYITVPYSKESMTAALSDLEATSKKLATNLQTKNSASSSAVQTSQQCATHTYSLPHKSECKSFEEDGQFLYQILSDCFAIPKLSLLQKMLDIRVSNTPVKVRVGSQTFYACPQCQIAYVNNISRLIDYCDMLYGLELSFGIIAVDPMENVEFERLTPIFEQKGYRKYNLNSLLWQICWRLLRQIDVPDHTLKLRMRYMPNFIQMKKIPEYIRPLVASCLTVPRSVDELIVLLDGDEQMKGQINRLMLVAILSGAADVDALRQSYAKQATIDLQKEDNDGIKVAKKTGFLARFLSKLSF